MYKCLSSYELASKKRKFSGLVIEFKEKCDFCDRLFVLMLK